MKSLFKFFSSVKLAIFLIAMITLASMLGTFIPQQRSPEEYIARFGQMADLFHRLQLTKLYQSSWFLILLILFGLNIIICTLSRLFPKLRKTFKPRIFIDSKELGVLKIKEKFKKKSDLDKTKQEMKRELVFRRYRIKEDEKENKVFLLARKKTLGWFGSDIVHLGILIILIGGVLSSIGRFRRNFTFLEGETLDIPKADFQLRLDKFETEYYPGGSARDWKSTLTVIEGTNPVLTKVIEVNHPLSYKGYVFYQSGYGWNWRDTSLELLVKKREDPSFMKTIELKVGEKVTMLGENIDVSVLNFIPDFVINEKNQVVTRSMEPNNPAVFIEGWQEDEKFFSGWIFARFPDFDRIHSTKETNLSFELKDFRANQFSVIQASKDPGANFIWVGCAFLMIGLFFAFYWPTREIRVILEEMDNKTEIIAGGVASKNRDAFQSEFEKFISSMRRAK